MSRTVVLARIVMVAAVLVSTVTCGTSSAVTHTRRSRTAPATQQRSALVRRHVEADGRGESLHTSVLADSSVAAALAASWYHVSATLPLTHALHGIDGRIELLEDARITSAAHAAMWGHGITPCSAAETSVADDDGLCERDGSQSANAPANARALHNAAVRIVTMAGVQLDRRALDRPLATMAMDTVDVRGRPAFFVTTDFSIGFGSYAGPATEIADVRNGRIAWLTARDAGTRRQTAITLPRTLKTDWRIVPRRDHLAGRDILLVECRPDFAAMQRGDSDAFYVDHIRFTQTDRGWAARARRTKGMWDSDEAFPPSSLFP